jgi:hypothetical protein
VLAGTRLSPIWACVAIATALGFTTLAVVLAKLAFDHVRARNSALIERYTEITGRVSALVIGTIACEMILRGLESWLTQVGAVS